jgi:hypothetical protein
MLGGAMQRLTIQTRSGEQLWDEVDSRMIARTPDSISSAIFANVWHIGCSNQNC